MSDGKASTHHSNLKSLVPHLEKQITLELRKRYRKTKINVCDYLENDAKDTKFEPSTTPLKDLKMCSLADLYVEQIALKQAVLVRTIEYARIVNGITTIVEDKKGNVIILCLFNFTDQLIPDPSDLLPVGTIILLKEPWAGTSTAGAYLRCDCPSDVFVVQEDHFMYKSFSSVKWKHKINSRADEVLYVLRLPTPVNAEIWLKRGNAFMRNGKYQQATRCYSIALKRLGSIEGKLKIPLTLKLSEAYFQRQFYEKATETAITVLIIDKINKDALFIAGKSLYQLRKYTQAANYFNARHNLQVLTNAVIDDDYLRKSLKREEEAVSTGDLDERIFGPMSPEHFQIGKPIERADYLGPIKIGVNCDGRPGVFATETLPEGTLLMVSKALAFSWSETAVRPRNPMYELGTSQHLIAKLAQMSMKNPRTFGIDIFSLKDRTKFSESAITIAKRMFCDPETHREPIVNVQDLRTIVKCFAFGVMSYDSDIYVRHDIMCPLKHGCGLFEMPSYFNTRNLPNAFYHDYSDIMVIKSTKLINEKEEIFLPHVKFGQ